MLNQISIMSKEDIIKLLKELKSQRGILGKIEWSLGIPQNNLSGYISGSKEIPKKFLEPLSKYLENGEYIRKTVELPKDFIGVEKVGIIRADGTIEEITHPSMLPEHMQMWFNAVKALTQEMPNGDTTEYSFIDKKGKPTKSAVGKSVTITLTKENHYDGKKTDRASFDEVGQYEDVKPDNLEIEKQIAAVKSETKPSMISKIQFEKYQERKINELKKQLK